MVQSQVLAAEEVVPGAPYQIDLSDLREGSGAAAIGRNATRVVPNAQTQLPMFPKRGWAE